MTKNSERQHAKDAPDPWVHGISYTRTVSGREYQSKQFLNPPLKSAAGGTAGNSGAILIQTGTGSNGDSGSLTLATGASASYNAGDVTTIVSPPTAQQEEGPSRSPLTPLPLELVATLVSRQELLMELMVALTLSTRLKMIPQKYMPRIRI